MIKGILIADAGSTKTKWSYLQNKECDPVRILSEGINPFHENIDNIQQKFLKIKEDLDDKEIAEIFFYGAGCASTEIKYKLHEALSGVFNCQKIQVESDMRGAALALFGDGKGIACILGTGSNSCIINKGEIIDKIPSLGYILGDEGSGVALGKDLLNAIFKNQVEDSIIKEFQDEYNLSLPELLKRVYKEHKPAPFIASFVPFILNHIQYPSVRKIAEKEFDNFFIKNVLPYGATADFKVGLVGSVAYHFRDSIKKCASQLGISVSAIIADPLPALEIYHMSR